MTKLSIELKDGMAYLTTPYHPDFVERIKALGGRWDAESKRWRVNQQSVEAVRAVMRAVYGEDDLKTDAKVTVVATFRETQSLIRMPYMLFGKMIASAYGRDTGAKVGEEAAFIEKSPRSGGSVKNWETVIPAGSVVEIYNVPRTLAEREAARSQAEDIQIRFEIKEDSAQIDREALTAEKERLLARVAEIDALLAADCGRK